MLRTNCFAGFPFTPIVLRVSWKLTSLPTYFTRCVTTLTTGCETESTSLQREKNNDGSKISVRECTQRQRSRSPPFVFHCVTVSQNFSHQQKLTEVKRMEKYTGATNCCHCLSAVTGKEHWILENNKSDCGGAGQRTADSTSETELCFIGGRVVSKALKGLQPVQVFSYKDECDWQLVTKEKTVTQFVQVFQLQLSAGTPPPYPDCKWQEWHNTSPASSRSDLISPSNTQTWSFFFQAAAQKRRAIDRPVPPFHRQWTVENTNLCHKNSHFRFLAHCFLVQSRDEAKHGGTLRMSNPIASSTFSVLCSSVFICRRYFCIRDTITVPVSASSVTSVSVSRTKYWGFDQYWAAECHNQWTIRLTEKKSLHGDCSQLTLAKEKGWERREIPSDDN